MHWNTLATALRKTSALENPLHYRCLKKAVQIEAEQHEKLLSERTSGVLSDSIRTDGTKTHAMKLCSETGGEL